MDRYFSTMSSDVHLQAQEQPFVSKEHIVELLNSEIERLTRARDLLVAGGRMGSRSASYKPGIRRRRPMSPETKRKISEMMKKRWEQRRRGR